MWLRSRALLGLYGLHLQHQQGSGMTKSESQQGAVKQDTKVCLHKCGAGGVSLKLLADTAPSWAWCQLCSLDSQLFKC